MLKIRVIKIAIIAYLLLIFFCVLFLFIGLFVDSLPLDTLLNGWPCGLQLLNRTIILC